MEYIWDKNDYVMMGYQSKMQYKDTTKHYVRCAAMGGLYYYGYKSLTDLVDNMHNQFEQNNKGEIT